MMLISCPVCHGSRKSLDPDYGETCTACRGSGTLDIGKHEPVGYVTRAGVKWTKEEEALLLQWRRFDFSYAYIAAMLCRTEDSVGGKIILMKAKGEWVDNRQEIDDTYAESEE
jgi:hypothetical protein